MRYLKLIFIFLCASITLGAYAATSTNPLDQLQYLTTTQQYQAAYELGHQLASHHAGELRFDYLYGIAAAHAGHPDVATFTLERVLLLQPNNARAKLEYGLSQYQLQNVVLAKRQFSDVLNSNPPPAVRNNIQALLDQINHPRQVADTLPMRHLMLVLHFNAGYNTNVNTGPVDNRFVIPLFAAFGPFSLGPQALPQKAYFAEVNPTLIVQLPLGVTNNVSLFGVLDGTIHRNNGVKPYDTNIATLTTGLTVKKERWTLTLPVILQSMTLGGTNYRNVRNGAVQLSYALQPTTTVGGFVSYGRYSYPRLETFDGLNYQDTHMLLLGPMGEYMFKRIPLDVYAKLYFGNETPLNPAFTHIGRTLWGIQSTLKLINSSRYQPYTSVQIQRSNYGGAVPGFFDKRQDMTYQLGVGVRYNINSSLMLEPSYNYISNPSNTPLYNYSQQMVMLSLTYAIGA